MQQNQAISGLELSSTNECLMVGSIKPNVNFQCQNGYSITKQPYTQN